MSFSSTAMHPGERLLLYVLRACLTPDADGRSEELDDGSGRITVTNGELAKRCGWSARYTVRKRVHGLVNRGLVKVSQNVDEYGSRLANTYVIGKG